MKNNLLKTVILLLSSLTLAFGLGELLLQIIPNNVCCICSPGIPFKDIGSWYAPNQNVRAKSSCFRIDRVGINSLGMRSSKDFSPEKSNQYRIAVFGDSYIDALQVDDREHFSALLQSYLPQSQVLNFGHKGFGTVDELVTWRTMAKQFKPDLVILAFYPGNDVANNSPLLDTSANPFKPRLVEEAGGFTIKTSGKVKSKLDFLYSIHSTLKEKICTYNWLFNKIGLPLVQAAGGKGSERQDDSRLSDGTSMEVYNEHADKAWKEAWKLTEQALLMIRDEVANQGAELMIVIIPPSLQYVSNPVAFGIDRKKLQNLDLGYPTRRLKWFSQQNGLTCIDLLPELLRYRDNHGLEYPVFSFHCDGHFNPLGHFLAANLVAEHLYDYFRDNSLISKVTNRSRDSFTTNLQRTPVDILGEEAWQAIYENGLYKGGSHAGNF